MSLGEILYKLFIGPLEMFFEVVFVIANRHVSNPAYAIILLSLAMNFLVLPLYRRADALQAEERDRENALAPWIRHIKKTFKGDERFMMLQAYYKENNYKPTDSLKGSVSLFLEIPFFIAAYHFLSHLETLRGVSFGPITDLGAPDALINIGAVTLNLLPILMTLINVISAAIYMKGFPLKSKVQMYGIAVIFLVFLYKSPAGLVFYWTLNNIFSLVKNVFYKLRNPGKVLRYLSSLVGALLLVLVLVTHPMGSNRAQLIVVIALLAMQLPLLMQGRKIDLKLPKASSTKVVFYGSAAVLTILVGLLIPSAVISDSAQEFIDPGNYVSPIWYIVSAVALAAGTFLIWFSVFYNLSSEKGKQLFTLIVGAGACCALINYMFFGKNYGNISNLLEYDVTPVIGKPSMLLNLLVLCLTVLLVGVVYVKKTEIIKLITVVLSLALIIMTGMNIASINSVLKKSEKTITAAAASTPEISLSKDGQNVVVIMMDRQIGHFVPFILNEKPELKDSFSGFTYFSNTFSYGSYTNVGAPGLFGGYDYIPEANNKRSDISLEEKHDEALKVMPKAFSDAGYGVNVINPTYAGYDWIPDLSIYDDIENVSASITNGKYSLEEYSYVPAGLEQEKVLKRNFFCYGLFKSSPLIIQPNLYDKGRYNAAPAKTVPLKQTVKGLDKASGYKRAFMDAYAALCNLPEITSTDAEKSTFTMMSNDTTHEPMLLQEPSYTPAPQVDNSGSSKVKTDENGNELNLNNEYQITHYHANMATMIKLAEWFDYLKKEGVYDNTRIIIVSDHGRDLNDNICPVVEYANEEGKTEELDTAYFNCVLMVKDFNSEGLSVDNHITSNADTPYYAMKDIIADPDNPYTGRKIQSFSDIKERPAIIYTHDWQTGTNNGNTFLPAPWFTVKNNIFEAENWEYLGTR